MAKRPRHPPPPPPPAGQLRAPARARAPRRGHGRRQLPPDQMLDSYRRGAELLAFCRKARSRRGRSSCSRMGSSSPGSRMKRQHFDAWTRGGSLDAVESALSSWVPANAPGWARRCATACSTAASACARCWCWPPRRRWTASARRPARAACAVEPDPRLFAGARRYAPDGQRRAAPGRRRCTSSSARPRPCWPATPCRRWPRGAPRPSTACRRRCRRGCVRCWRARPGTPACRRPGHRPGRRRSAAGRAAAA